MPKVWSLAEGVALAQLLRALVLFSANLTYNLKSYESENFSDFSLYHIFEYENFRFPSMNDR